MYHKMLSATWTNVRDVRGSFQSESDKPSWSAYSAALEQRLLRATLAKIAEHTQLARMDGAE
jgi:hypothetical protein